MGLKQRLIEAKVQAIQDTSPAESVEVDTSAGSIIEREAQYTAEAILETLQEANFTITQLKAPVIVEELKTPDQPVNIELDTLLAEHIPILKVLRKIGSPIPGIDRIIDQLESAIEKAITPVLEKGAKLVGLDLNKDSGGLESKGYVYIGEDPESLGGFDVGDVQGQRDFTTVKLIDEDASELV